MCKQLSVLAFSGWDIGRNYPHDYLDLVRKLAINGESSYENSRFRMQSKFIRGVAYNLPGIDAHL